MAVSIGQVTQITGKFILIDAEGKQHVLKAGDTIHKGERIVAQGGSAIVVTLDNQQLLTLDDKANTVMDASVLGEELFSKEDVTVDGEALAALMVESVDADDIGETAAGSSNQTTYVAGGSFVDREANAGDANAQTSATSFSSSSNTNEEVFVYKTTENDALRAELAETKEAAVTAVNTTVSTTATTASTALSEVEAANDAADVALTTAVTAAVNIDVDDAASITVAVDAVQAAVDVAAIAQIEASQAITAAQDAVNAAQAALDLAVANNEDITDEQVALDAANAVLTAAQAEQSEATQGLVDAASQQTATADAVAVANDAEAISDEAVALVTNVAVTELIRAEADLETAQTAQTTASQVAILVPAIADIDISDPLSLQSAEDLAQAAIDAATTANQLAEDALESAEQAVLAAEIALQTAIDNNEDITVQTATLEDAQSAVVSATAVLESSQVNLQTLIAADEAIEDLIINAELDLDTSSDSGANSNDDITNDSTPTYTGSAEIGSSVTVVFVAGDGREISGQALLDANGSWTYTPAQALADGDYTVRVDVEDEAGNIKSTSTTVVVDTAAQEGTITVDAIAGDNVLNETELTQTTQTVSGTATGGDIIEGDSVTVTVNGNEYTTEVSAAGTFSVAVATADLVADGSVDVSVVSGDAAGNAVTSSMTATTVISDSGITNPSSTEPITATIDALTNDNTPRITGTTEAGSTVVITDSQGTVVGTTVADETGNYSVDTSELTDGSQTLTVTVTDSAGNSASTSTTVIVDTAAQEGTITVDTIAGDNVLNETELTQTTQTVSGTAIGGDITEGDSVTVMVNGNEYTTEVSAAGTYSVAVATADLVADGSVDVSVASSDAAGNAVTSSTTAVAAVSIDATAGLATIELDTTSDTGGSSSDNITRDNTPTLSGSAESGSIVSIIIAGTVVASVIADSSGSWSYTSEALADGSYDISTDVTDPAGNTTSSSVETIIIDTGAPLSPEITNIYDLNGDSSEVIMTGTAGHEGNTINLYDESGSIVATTQVLADGSWNIDISNLPHTLVNDNEFFTAKEVDIAGNESLPSDKVHYAHYDWSHAETEVSDDYAIAGAGDDTLIINDNDANDLLVVDGGQGNDTVVFDEEKDEYEITVNDHGEVVVTESNGDVNTIRNVENFVFAQEPYTLEELIEEISTDLETLYHDNNGQGNGEQDAPGRSADHVVKDNDEHQEDSRYGNNGQGNGEQEAPGRSADHVAKDNDDHEEDSKHDNNGQGNGEQEAPGESSGNFDKVFGEGQWHHEESDSLLISDSVRIDFSNLEDKVEHFNLGEGSQHIENLSVKDVLDITNDSNELVIHGDATDHIEIDTDNAWTATGEVSTDTEGKTFDVYQGCFADETVTLKIETNIIIDDIV